MSRNSEFIETTVSLPRHLWAEVHRLAVREGVRLQDVVQTLLAEAIAAKKSGRADEAQEGAY
jgi:hypothetical protein